MLDPFSEATRALKLEVIGNGREVFRLAMGETRRAFCGCLLTSSPVGLTQALCTYHRFHPFSDLALSPAAGKAARRWTRAHRVAIAKGRLRWRTMRVRITIDGKPGREWRLPRGLPA